MLAEGTQRLEADLERERIRRLALIETEQKRAGLLVKQTCLDAVLESVKSAIGNIPDDEKKVLLTKLAAQAMETFKSGVIFVNPNDKGLVSAPAGFEVKEDTGIAFGLRAVSGDGKMALDSTLETLLNDSWQSHLSDTAKILFDA